MVLITVGIITTFAFEFKYAGILQFLIPVLGIAVVYVIEYLYKIKKLRKNYTAILRILAIPLLVLGFNWFCIFTLTSYRAHHRPIAIPLSICFIGLGLLLTHYNLIKKSK